jgi:V8-like Glu-specific endopeptidase
MRKLLAGLLAALMLLVAPMAPAIGITDIGRSELTRLWVPTDEGSRFVCTASYIQPYIDDSRTWIVSAGHCAVATEATRNRATGVSGIVNWRAVVDTHGEYGTQTVDLALGTVPDVRNTDHRKLWLAAATPEEASRIYIASFPEGVETVTTGILVPKGAEAQVSLLVQEGYGPVRKTITEMYPGTRLMLVKHDRIGHGSSGAPVLNGNDRIVGILWGGISYASELEIQGIPDAFEGWDLVFMTPIDEVHKLFKTLGVDG